MAYKDPEEQRRYQREWIAERRREWFAEKRCAKCDSTTDLELDHLDPGLKVSHRVWSWSQALRDIEVAKCQVLCATCHRQKTVDNGERARGEANGQSVRTAEIVLEVRRRRRAGMSLAQAGEPWGIDKARVRELMTETWQWLREEDAA